MKKIISLTLALALCLGLCVPALAVEFSDVPVTHAFYEAISDCSGKGIVGGYSDGNFQPGKTVTRSNFSVMLSRAFYADEVAKYSTGQYQGFMPNFMALYNGAVLNGVGWMNDIGNASVMNQGINRYDMAQLMTNIMNQKGFAASDAEKSAVVSEIADYNSISSQYQDAVLNVYALGVITGYSNGSFNGEGIMNRGQACVVIYRMMQYSGNAGTTTPSTPTEPETPKSTAIKVTSGTFNGYNSNDTGWEVADNGWETGKLNNGKPITEENVLELLMDAKKIWPHGISWNGNYGSGTNYYYYGKSNADSVTVHMLALNHKTTGNYACGGFAAMLSDYIFGASNNNPLRKLDDNSKVRPGDIVIRLQTNSTMSSHVNIAVSTAGKTDGGNLGVKTADGNSGSIVSWGDTATNYPVRIDDYQRAAGMSRCVIYTRYPD